MLLWSCYYPVPPPHLKILYETWQGVCCFARLSVLSPQDCQTALMLASYSGHTEVVQLLLSSGAKVDLQNKVRHINYISISSEQSLKKRSALEC